MLDHLHDSLTQMLHVKRVERSHHMSSRDNSMNMTKKQKHNEGTTSSRAEDPCRMACGTTLFPDHTNTHTHSHTQTVTHPRTHTHTYIHTYTHTQRQTPLTACVG